MKSQSKFSFFSFLLAALTAFSLSAQDNVSTDSTGYPGDGFSLEGALELFKTANSPEAFEKALNAEDNSVNNLDLNEDGEVDYVRVVDNMSDKAHAIVLQVPLNEKESQDIAVIEIEEQGKENAILQIVGDADVYGEETLVEPFKEEAKSDGKGGPSVNARIARVVVNVYFWPCVRYVYRPSYVVYVSPWGWRTYPNYWRPWRPYPWHVYHSKRVVYHHHYHHVHKHRVVHAHKVYTPHRRTSTTVHVRTTSVKAMKGSRGNTVVKKTTATKSVNTRNAATATTKSSTTKVAKTNNNKVTTGNENNKAASTNKKASTTSKAPKTNNNKKVTTTAKPSTQNKPSSSNKSAATKSTKTPPSKPKSIKPSQQQKASQSKQKSAKQGANRSGTKGGSRGGGKKRGNR